MKRYRRYTRYISTDTYWLQSVLYIYPDSLLPTYLFANEPTCWTSCIRRGWEKGRGGGKERERRQGSVDSLPMVPIHEFGNYIPR